MGSPGRIGWDLDRMVPAKAASTAIRSIFSTVSGIVIGYADVTTAAALDGFTDGTFAPGALVICVNSDAVNTVQLMINEGISTAPAFKSVISVGGIDPDA